MKDKINDLLKNFGILSMGAASFIFMFNEVTGRVPDPLSTANIHIQNFMQAVGLVVAAIPEGIFISITFFIIIS